MKNIAKTIVLALFALLATAAFAGDASSKISLHLTSASTISGTKLAPGDYNLYVTRDGDNAKVRVTNGPKELVNTTAKYRAMDQFVGGVAVAKTAANDIVEVQSSKLKGALVFSATEGTGTSEGSSK